MEIQPHQGNLGAVQLEQQPVEENYEIIQVKPERGEWSKEEGGLEMADIAVVLCDTTSSEEVIAIMVDKVKPQRDERGLGT